MKTAVELGIGDRIADSIRLAVPQPTEWQRIGDEIKAAMIFAGADFVKNRLVKERHPLNSIAIVMMAMVPVVNSMAVMPVVCASRVVIRV